MMQKNLFKYFVEYNDDDVISPLFKTLLKMTGNARKHYESATMSFRLYVLVMSRTRFRVNPHSIVV